MRCAGIKKDGRPCMRGAYHGPNKEFCYEHADREKLTIENETGSTDEVYLHHVICKRCEKWTVTQSHRGGKGRCEVSGRWKGPNARACGHFEASAQAFLEIVLEGACLDGKIKKFRNDGVTKYGLPDWPDDK